MKIAPSILTIDYLNIQAQLEILMEEGIDTLHLDVMDGVFVPNLSFGPAVIKSIASLFKGLLEAHLMIRDPENSVQNYIDAGCKRIIFHPESTTHAHRLCQQIKSQGCEVGLVLNPATPLSVLDYLIDESDLILLMTVNPGFGGQSYITSMNKKIENLVTKRNQLNRNKDLIIEVDGGVKAESLGSLKALGVDLAVVGSGVFNNMPVRANLKALKEQL